MRGYVLQPGCCLTRGSVYGAGQGGSILAGSSVCLTGGLVKGDVYAGGKAGSIQGDTSVTITGNTATLYNGSSWGSISGGGSGGTDAMSVGWCALHRQLPGHVRHPQHPARSTPFFIELLQHRQHATIQQRWVQAGVPACVAGITTTGGASAWNWE